MSSTKRITPSCAPILIARQSMAVFIRTLTRSDPTMAVRSQGGFPCPTLTCSKYLPVTRSSGPWCVGCFCLKKGSCGLLMTSRLKNHGSWFTTPRAWSLRVQRRWRRLIERTLTRTFTKWWPILQASNASKPKRLV